MLKQSGVYQIVNTVNGKRYVGSAVCLRKRWWNHRDKLLKNAHKSKHLQYSWNKYGADVFVFQPLLVCSREDVIFYEQRAIDHLSPEYNTAKIAGNTLGVRCSEAAKRKIAAANRGRVPSQETREKIRKANTGQRRTPEQKVRIKEALSKVEWSVERREQAREHMASLNKTPMMRELVGSRTRSKPGKAPMTPEKLANMIASRKAAAEVITYGGQSLPLMAWSDVVGIPLMTLYKRKEKGWTVDEMLGIPLKGFRKRVAA